MNPALLDNITHRHLRIHTERAAQRGDARHVALALPAEFRQLQAHFPIVFQLVDGGAGFQPVALFG
ncbi:SapC family protein, partial [Acinetobacter baumannii]